MDFFEEAVESHIGWKARIRACVEGRGEALDPVEIGRDDRCDLGRWIHGEGANYASLADYQELLVAHARFHQCCGRIVGLARAGQSDQALAALAGDGDFFAASSETVVAIGRLRTAIEDERGY